MCLHVTNTSCRLTQAGRAMANFAEADLVNIVRDAPELAGADSSGAGLTAAAADIAEAVVVSVAAAVAASDFAEAPAPDDDVLGEVSVDFVDRNISRRLPI